MKGKHVVLAVAVLVAVVAAAMLWLDLRQERAQGSELAARVAALEVAPAPAATSAVPGPVAPVPAGAGVPPAAATAPAAAPAAPVPPPVTSPERSGAPQSPVAAVLDTMRTPQGQEFAQTMMRGVMGQMYPDIAEKMGMSQQEADALFDLLLRQQQEIATDSIGLLTGSVQDPAARREIQRNLVEKQRAQEAELAAHLGARHGQWEDYQATAAARQQVNELRTALAGSDPLGDEQYDKLVAAFATETRRATEEVREWTYSAAAVDSPNMMQETMQRTVAAQRNLLEVARPHLNATQNAHYQRQMEQQMGMLQAVMGMMGGQGAPGAGQPPAPAAAPR